MGVCLDIDGCAVIARKKKIGGPLLIIPMAVFEAAASRQWRSTRIRRFGEPEWRNECFSGQKYVKPNVLLGFFWLLDFCRRCGNTGRLQNFGELAQR